MIAAECPRGGDLPVNRVDSHTDSSLCAGCGRRVRVTSSGRLRPHRKVSAIEIVDGEPARRMPPP